MKSIKIAPVVSLLAILASPGLAQDGDAKKGERVFKKCKACHMVGDGAKNRVGPILNGIIDAPAAQVKDFKFSKAMKEAGETGLVWDTANLTEFLTKPKSFMKGTKMTFAGIKKEKDIVNLLAYLAEFE